MNASTVARFQAKVEPTDGCWYWRACLNAKGYGEFHLGGGSKHVLAHRFAWEQANGRSIPEGMIVMHLCDTPSCVRPEHLRLATVAENQRDMALKGRAGQRGLRSPQAKLTDDAVREIRRRCGAGESHRLVAANLGVSRELVREVAAGRRWRHVM